MAQMILETEPHPPNRALVASFLFTDLVGFSKGTAAEQHAAKATLSAILRNNLATLRDADYRLKDTGDGALIAFTSNPEHALYMALAIAEDFGRAAAAAGFPSNSLRTGVHLGTVKESLDVEARPNFIGDGINAAKRIMDFAAPGQITASRAFFDAVGSLDSAYAELFKHVGAPDDKHGRAHELYAISPSAPVLEKLKLDLGAAHPSAELPAKSPAPLSEKQKSATVVAGDAGTRSGQGVAVARKWLLPTIAVIVLGIASIFVATRLTESNGPKVPQATTESASSPSGSNRAPAPSPSAAGAPVGSSVSPAIPPKPEVTQPAGAASIVEGPPTPGGPSTPGGSPALDSKQPVTAPATAAAKTNRIKSRTEGGPAAPASAGAAPESNSLRCSRIMEKATLGEALSTVEKKELANSCR